MRYRRRRSFKRRGARSYSRRTSRRSTRSVRPLRIGYRF